MKKRTLNSPAKKGYHHGNLRKALVASAIEILEEEGFQALSLRAAARRAGVSQAAPYHHFKDKSGLLAAIAARGFLDMADAQKTAARGASAPLDRLRALGRGYVTFGLEHPALLRLMFGPEIASPTEYPDLAAVSAENYKLLTDAVAALLTSAENEANEPRAVAVTAWALVHGLTMLMIDGRLTPAIAGADSADKLIDQVTAAFVKGI